MSKNNNYFQRLTLREPFFLLKRFYIFTRDRNLYNIENLWSIRKFEREGQ